MKTGEVCNRTVVIVGRETPLGEAAKLMRENHVGSLVVAKNTYGRKRAYVMMCSTVWMSPIGP